MKLVIEYFPEHDQGDKFSTCFRITSLTNQPLANRDGFAA